MNNQILSSPEIQARLIDLEYKELPIEELEKEIRKIYLEETGELLHADIDILHSSNSEDNAVLDSGYDGTAIHISNKNKDEVYVISQGTKDIKDWEYNIKAMLAAKTGDQAVATDRFVKEASDYFNIEEDRSSIFGLSHSLAHNNNTTSYLIYDTFDEVFSVNGAQTNYYQLYWLDNSFFDAVKSEFKILNRDDIYDLPPQELHTFAMDFYGDKAENIIQYISKDDPLYAVSAVRGFFALGAIHTIDTNPEVPGLRAMFEDVPDDVVKSFQELAIDYTVASEQGGTKAGIQEILGVDLEYLQGLDIGTGIFDYVFRPGKIDDTISQLNEKLPSVLGSVHIVTENGDIIFGRMEEAGYITKDQKDTLIKEFKNIDQELSDLQQLIANNDGVRGSGAGTAIIGADIVTAFQIYQHYKTLTESFHNIEESGFLDSMDEIVESHGLKEMLTGMSDGRKSYVNGDMVYTASKGEPIKVNISAALRLYQQAIPKLEEKETIITNLEKAVRDEIELAYKEEKQKVMTEINQMESSPGSYRNLLRKHVYFSRLDKTIRRIDVHEEFYPLENADLDAELAALRDSIDKGRTFISDYKKAIEDLFEEEDIVSQILDLSGRI